MMFRPGPMSPSEAAEASWLSRVVRNLCRLHVTGARSFSRTGDGVISMDVGSPAGDFVWLYVIGDDGNPEPDTRYDYRVVTFTDAGGWAFDGSGTVTAKLVRAPIGEYSQVYRKKLQQGDVVLARPSATEPGFFECQFEPRTALKGKLNATLTKGGSSTMSVYAYNGSAEAWTGETLTVFDWELSTGQTVASGSNVHANYMGGRWYVVGAQCTADAVEAVPAPASLTVTLHTSTVSVT